MKREFVLFHFQRVFLKIHQQITVTKITMIKFLKVLEVTKKLLGGQQVLQNNFRLMETCYKASYIQENS